MALDAGEPLEGRVQLERSMKNAKGATQRGASVIEAGSKTLDLLISGCPPPFWYVISQPKSAKRGYENGGITDK